MKYLFEDTNALKAILNHPKIGLFLDYDGTLAPIAKLPEHAYIPSLAKKMLEKFSQSSYCSVYIVSGRSRTDIEKMVGIKDIAYVGNHGFEIRGLGLEFEAMPCAEYAILLEHLKKEIDSEISEFPGAFIEDKGVTISVHFRQVDPEQTVVLENLLYRIIQTHITHKELRVNSGKKVFEIKPPFDWNKGKAVMWILDRQKSFPIYIGDDTTDEDAFLALKDRGITIYVGNSPASNAQYYLRNPDEVIKFLEYLYEVKNNATFSKS